MPRRLLLVLAMSLLPVAAAVAADAPAKSDTPAKSTAPDKDAEIRELRSRVEKLEARLAELEKQLGPALAKSGAEQERAKLTAKAHERMRQDLQTHTAEQIGQAEALYQVANKNWRTPEARASLRKMIDQFPHLNRTGCALLYLGQMSDGDEKEKLLKEAIDSHGDCFYGDGVQVGPFARFLLAEYYREKKEPAKAKALFDEVRRDFPEAIDHKGKRLVEQMPE
jgi:TolA-binding protein